MRPHPLGRPLPAHGEPPPQGAVRGRTAGARATWEVGLLPGSTGTARVAPLDPLRLIHQLRRELPDPTVDLVADRTHVVQWLAGGVRQLPVLVPDPGEDRTGIAASHRDHDVAGPDHVGIERLGRSAERSIPTSAIASTTAGFSRSAGSEPADRTRTSPAECRSSNAAASGSSPRCGRTRRGPPGVHRRACPPSLDTVVAGRRRDLTGQMNGRRTSPACGPWTYPGGRRRSDAWTSCASTSRPTPSGDARPGPPGIRRDRGVRQGARAPGPTGRGPCCCSSRRRRAGAPSS